MKNQAPTDSPLPESSDEESEPAASSRPAARLVGSITDSAVRDDGLYEPQVKLVESADALPRRGAAREGSHPVRDRLLARAALARERTAASAATAELPEVGGSSNAEAPSARAAEADESDANVPAGPPGAIGSSASSSVALPPESAPSRETAGEGDTYEVRDTDLFESLPSLTDDLDQIGTAPPPPAATEQPATASTLWVTAAGCALAFVMLFAMLLQVSPREPWRVVAPEANEAQVDAPVSEPELPAPIRPPRKTIPGPWRVADAANDPNLRRVQGQIGRRSFLTAMDEAGIGVHEAYRVITAFKGIKNLDRCRPRDRFDALVERATGKLSAFEYVVSDEEIYQARTDDEDLLKGQQLDLHILHQRVTGVIPIQGDFESSALAAGFDPGLSSVVNKALAGYATVDDLQTGEVLAVVAQEVTILGQFSRYAGIEALEYRKPEEKPLRIYYHDAGKTRGYVDEQGRMFGMGRWAKPVKDAVRTSPFNPRRMHPILKVIRPHNGTDFAAPTGTPVLAAAEGKVSFVGDAGPNGNFVRIQHSGGYETGYSHLSRFARGLEAGDSVRRRQVVGYVGSTGRSTGPHLHFSAKKNGRFIDPESLGLDAFARLPVSDRQQLARLRKRYDEMLSKLTIPEPKKPIPLVTETRALSAAGDPAQATEGVPAATQAPAPARSAATVAAAPATRVTAVQAAAAAPRAAAGTTASASVSASRNAASLYLTDLELMRQQPKTHSGEVDP